ncbi:tryptophan 7-halogenase [Caulobacter segnis]
MLLCDRAVWCRPGTSATRTLHLSRAEDAGWRWRIPLQPGRQRLRVLLQFLLQRRRGLAPPWWGTWRARR